ncbi:hypothetical protein [Herminiimonas fonticola]|uniref:hypothetical protein n=1 Tax=Herminiimonas fonticola TaxID=303380 RepID=UPI000DD92494|nr:hypothetical protein [Herminiimonas fonticola]
MASIHSSRDPSGNPAGPIDVLVAKAGMGIRRPFPASKTLPAMPKMLHLFVIAGLPEKIFHLSTLFISVSIT